MLAGAIFFAPFDPQQMGTEIHYCNTSVILTAATGTVERAGFEPALVVEAFKTLLFCCFYIQGCKSCEHHKSTIIPCYSFMDCAYKASMRLPISPSLQKLNTMYISKCNENKNMTQKFNLELEIQWITVYIQHGIQRT